MSTTADEIKGFIIDELKDDPNFNINHPVLLKLIDAFSKGTYKGMQKLDDLAGMPASTGHK